MREPNLITRASPNWNTSIETQKTEALFVAALEGDGQVLWAAIETVTGKSRHELSGAVATVRRHMFKEYGVDFMPMQPTRGNTGFRVRTDAEQADATDRFVGRVRRQEGRRRKRMERVDVAKLATDERLHHYGSLLRMEEVRKSASRATARKIDSAIKNTNNMTAEEQRQHIDLLRALWKK